jgi:hypothetical protein
LSAGAAKIEVVATFAVQATPALSIAPNALSDKPMLIGGVRAYRFDRTALRNGGVMVESAGYAVAHAVAGDNLRAGQTVVAGCVNPWALTRDEWRAVGERSGVPILEVEVVCGDRAEHRVVSNRVPPTLANS